MKKVDLNVNKRVVTGKNQTVKLFKEDKVPGILYNKDEANTRLKIDISDISTLINKNGQNIVVELKFDNQSVPAIIKEVQRDPVTKKIVHIDFQPISLHEIIHAEIPIHVVNGNSIEKNGWIINKQLSAVEVEGEAERIPQSVKVDVAKLSIGDVVKVEDIEMVEEISILTDKNSMVLTVKEFKNEPADVVIEPTEEDVAENKEH